MSSKGPIIIFIKTSHLRYGNELLAPWSILDHSNTINTSHRLLEGIGYNLPDWVCQRTEELSHRLWTKRFCKQLYLLDWVVWCDYDPLRPDLHRASLCFRNKTEWWWMMNDGNESKMRWMTIEWCEWLSNDMNESFCLNTSAQFLRSSFSPQRRWRSSRMTLRCPSSSGLYPHHHLVKLFLKAPGYSLWTKVDFPVPGGPKIHRLSIFDSLGGAFWYLAAILLMVE